MPPRPVADLDLADAEAPGMRQDRNETVQLAIDADLPQHLAAVELEPAIVVVQAAAGQAADHPVEDAAGIDLVPGVVPGLLPAADHVVALVELGQEARDLGRVVLKVAVEREDQVAPAAWKPAVSAAALPKLRRNRIASTLEDRAGPARPGQPTSRRGCRRRRR